MKNNALTVPLCKRRQSKPPWYSKTDFGPAEAVGRSQTRPVERENIRQPSLLKCSNITGKQITFVDFNRNTISFLYKYI